MLELYSKIKWHLFPDTVYNQVKIFIITDILTWYIVHVNLCLREFLFKHSVQ